jgi:hypothetical protein
MSTKSEREMQKKLQILVPTEKDDETFMEYHFEPITDAQKNDVAFNDGELAFTLRQAKPPIITTAVFRSTTNLTKEEFRAAYPVKQNTIKFADIVAVLLRKAWQKQ